MAITPIEVGLMGNEGAVVELNMLSWALTGTYKMMTEYIVRDNTKTIIIG